MGGQVGMPVAAVARADGSVMLAGKKHFAVAAVLTLAGCVAGSAFLPDVEPFLDRPAAELEAVGIADFDHDD